MEPDMAFDSSLDSPLPTRPREISRLSSDVTPRAPREQQDQSKAVPVTTRLDGLYRLKTDDSLPRPPVFIPTPSAPKFQSRSTSDGAESSKESPFLSHLIHKNYPELEAWLQQRDTPLMGVNPIAGPRPVPALSNGISQSSSAEFQLLSPQRAPSPPPATEQKSAGDNVATVSGSGPAAKDIDTTDSAASRTNPYYCRACQADPCQVPAVTVCGHLFCYDCITKEIVEKSRCPVCQAVTLLYCVFKLDLPTAV